MCVPAWGSNLPSWGSNPPYVYRHGFQAVASERNDDWLDAYDDSSEWDNTDDLVLQVREVPVDNDGTGTNFM